MKASLTRLLGACAVLALAGCGRDVTSSDVKLLNVGNDPDEIGSVRFCPDCGREWKQVG